MDFGKSDFEYLKENGFIESGSDDSDNAVLEHAKIAVYYFRKREHDNCISFVNDILGVGPLIESCIIDTILLFVRGFSFMQLGEYAKAIHDFDALVKDGSERHEIYASRGVCHHRLLNYKLAISDLKSAITMCSTTLDEECKMGYTKLLKRIYAEDEKHGGK